MAPNDEYEPEPVVVPIEESIDLHHFHPSEVLPVVDAYLDAARERGFREVRLIHGRGKGVQRANVQRMLEGDPRVERFVDAPGDRGGWGATLAWLAPSPETGRPVEGSRPRLFVGDVQGCADELDELLARAGDTLGGDFELWCVGDLINRGPGNLRVLERVRALHDAGRARMVLGNHEIGFLLKALGLRALGSSDTVHDLLGSRERDDWIEWLRALPLVEAGELAGERFAMVHAAAHPAWDLDELVARASEASARLRAGGLDELRAFLDAPAGEPDSADSALDVLNRLTRCRSVALQPPDGEHWSDATPEVASEGGEERFVPWHEAWSARGHDYGVVYGHWALQGLHVARGLRGLDTGCVHHGRDHDGFLTAWVPDGSAGFAAVDDRLWQVRARRRYYRGE